MLSREDTKSLTGIAILLMLAHYLFAYTERIPWKMEVTTSIVISGKELTMIVGEFGSICVAVFMFLGGYSLFVSCVSRKNGTVQVKNILYHKIIRLYSAYWKVFLIFVPVGFLFFGGQQQYCNSWSQCTRFIENSFLVTIPEFFGVTSYINSEWWLFRTYLFALFEGFIFIELFKNKRDLYRECAAIIIWNILISQVFPALTALPAFYGLSSNIWYQNLFMINEYASGFFVGIVFAKYDVFTSWKRLFENRKKVEKIVLSLFAAAGVVYLKVYSLPSSCDLLLAPIFVMACAIFVEETGVFKRILMFLGGYSTNMWLIHSFYCYYFYFFVKIVYGLKNPVISMVILTILSLGSSILVDLFWKGVKKGYTFLITRVPLP